MKLYLQRLLYRLTTTPRQRRDHEIQDRANAELPRLISQAGRDIFKDAS